MAKDFKGDVERLIKGVNKQIVEIKCTNNEYFDRALLFVSSGRNEYSDRQAEDMAREYISELSAEFTHDDAAFLRSRKKTRVLQAVLIVLLITSALLGMLFVCK